MESFCSTYAHAAGHPNYRKIAGNRSCKRRKYVIKIGGGKPPKKSIDEKIEYKINENGSIDVYYKIKAIGLNKTFELFKDYEIDETFGKKLLEKINNIKKYYRLRIEY